MTPDEWRTKFTHVNNNPPAPLTILEPKEGKIAFTFILEPNKAPILETRAYVPMIVGEEPKWYAQHEVMNQGMRCFMLPKSRNNAIRLYGMDAKVIYVNKIRVINRSLKGKSLIVDVVEWNDQ